MINVNARQTGRTTRMLEEAKRLSRMGFAVYVVAAYGAQAAHFKDKLRDYPSIKVETFDTLDNLNPTTLTLRDAWPSCRVLVDHYAIECEYAGILEELVRYDRENINGYHN